MTNQVTYLATEFRRYFPDAKCVCVHPHDEEIYVRVVYADPDGYRDWVMDIGSDDDRYIFHAVMIEGAYELNMITVPLQAS